MGVGSWPAALRAPLALMLVCGAAASMAQSAGTAQPGPSAQTAQKVQRAPKPSPLLDGRVTHVTDGDSLWLTPAEGPPVEIRLLGIDAPEGCQPWGPEARRALEDLALRQEASVRTQGRDDYGRTLGTVFVGGTNVNVRLVEEGHAWSMRYKWDQGPYVKEERMAKALTRGLHAAGGAVMPREFRRSHGPCQSGGSAASGPARAAPGALPAAAAAWRCDGRTRCSQMSSCAEATFFLRNCPGVQMDGNRDGVPCESQWCR